MRATRSIIIGLAVLYDLARAAEAEPYTASLELRAVLGLLHALSGGKRDSYDRFWKAATEIRPPAYSVGIGKICRTNDLLAAWHGILYTLGMEPSIDLMSAIHRANDTGKPAKPRRTSGGL